MQTEGWGKMQGLLFFGAFSTASLERMAIVTQLSRRMLVSVGAFIALTVAGSVLLGFICFPAQSHVPTSVACDISLFSPTIAAVVAGLLFGRKVALVVSPLAAFAPAVGLGVLFLTGHVRYWYGHDISAALLLAATYCLLPSVVASAASAIVFSRPGDSAL